MSMMQSGFGPIPFPVASGPSCDVCGKPIEGSRVTAITFSESGFNSQLQVFHQGCVGYNSKEKRFPNLQELLQQVVPNDRPSAPAFAVADWLEEHGWQQLSEEVRKLK